MGVERDGTALKVGLPHAPATAQPQGLGQAWLSHPISQPGKHEPRETELRQGAP